MAVNLGKKFEEQFKKDFLNSVPNSTIDRLYDTMNGFKAITQVSDFIGYSFPNIMYLECKEHKGASIPIGNITQYEKLLPKVGIPGVRAGVVLWLSEKDKVYYIPVSTITQMIKDGKKSIGLKAVEEGYRIIEVPSEKKRVFMTSDYSILLQLNDGD